METIKPTIKALKEYSVEATIELEKFKSSTNIPELCRLLKELKESLDMIEELVKTVNNVKEELSTKVLANLFENSNVDSIKTANRQFTYSGKLYASIKAGKHEEANEWFRNNGYEGAIKENVHPQTLSTCIREFNEEKGLLPPDDIFHIFIKKEVSVKKVRS